MRMSGFVMGGLVGAAMVMYFSRDKRMMSSNLSEMGNSMGKIMSNAREKMNRIDLFSSNSNNSSNSSNSSNNSNSSNITRSSNNSNNSKGVFEPSLEKVDQLVNQDPDVKSRVNEILSKNQESSPSITKH